MKIKDLENITAEELEKTIIKANWQMKHTPDPKAKEAYHLIYVTAKQDYYVKTGYSFLGLLI